LPLRLTAISPIDGLVVWNPLSTPSPVHAQLSVLEPSDLRLLSLSPSESFLAPHVARCFLNSLRFQRRLFDYQPAEKVTLLLNDFADYGNASAGARG